MTPQEIQLATVAGCVEYLSGKPKCRMAARELMKVLRTEQLRLNIGGQREGHEESHPLLPEQHVRDCEALPSHPNLNRFWTCCTDGTAACVLASAALIIAIIKVLI